MASELSQFTRERFSTKRFAGLPLTILATLFVLTVALFAQTAEGVINAEPIVHTDLSIASYFDAARTNGGDMFWYGVTVFGFWQVIVTLSLITIAIMYAKRHSHLIAPFMLCVIGSTSTVEILKLLVHRTRPEFAYYLADGYSFPSGHAAISIAGYGFFAYLLARFVKRDGGRLVVVFAAFLFALMIGFSRIYLGVHFLSDVWAGYLLGGAWLIIGIAFAELTHALEKDKRAGRRFV